MAYCSTCGQQVEESALYCSQCGTDLHPATPGESTPPEAPSPRRVLDVLEPPSWLGWLAFAAALAFYVLGIGLYCVWAYYRGKRDGFGAQTELEPSEGMGLATIGWSLALFVPFVNWYAIVHLPTMLYKHGLVVGASSDRAPPRLVTSVYAVFVGLGLASLAVGAILLAGALSDGEGQPAQVADPTAAAEPTRSPTPEPTEYRLRLTGTEAASKAKSDFVSASFDNAPEPLTPEQIRRLAEATCIARDFNDYDLAWIVVCMFADSSYEFIYAVDDLTGEVERR